MYNLNDNVMKKLGLIVVSLMILPAFAFSQESQTKDDKSTSVTSSQSTGTGSVSSKVSGYDRGKELEFVNEAASGGLMEIQLGRLAQQKGSSQQVKDYGRMMERDHADASNKLKMNMQKLGIPAPSTMLQKHEDNIEKLSKESGAEFDKAYIDLMVKDHKEDVNKFEKAAENIQEPSLKEWTSNTLPVLKKHLALAEQLQEQIK